MRTYMAHKYKPKAILSHGFVVERWSGKAWYSSLGSPYKTMAEVRSHLTKYWWHYTDENPYRIKDYKPAKVQKYVPKYNKSAWNTDDDMVVCYGTR